MTKLAVIKKAYMQLLSKRKCFIARSSEIKYWTDFRWIKDACEPSCPSGRSLSRFLQLVDHRATPSIRFAGFHSYTWVERGTVKVKRLAQEHNTMSSARARTQNKRKIKLLFLLLLLKPNSTIHVREKCTQQATARHQATAPASIPDKSIQYCNQYWNKSKM